MLQNTFPEGAVQNFMTFCYCCNETETNALHKAADNMTRLGYRITKNELNISIGILSRATHLFVCSLLLI